MDKTHNMIQLEQDEKYTINLNNIVHENDTFIVDVGHYPGEELVCYRVFNKNTMVLEYAHSILFYILQWASSAEDILKKGVDENNEESLPDAS